MKLGASTAHALRSLPTLLKVGFAGAVAYRSEFIVWVLSTTMPFVMLALFWAVAADAPVGNFGQPQFAAYFLVTWVVRQMVSCWVVWEMNMEIRSGTLSMRLLRPIHPFLSYATDNLAIFPLRLLISLPVIVLALVWVGPRAFSGDPLLWALVPFSILAAWGINFAANTLIGTLGLFWESSISVFDLWLGMFFIFSGYLFPLQLFPAWAQPVVQNMPFRSLLSLPVEMCLGMLDRGAALRGMALQLGYLIAFVLGAQAVWRAGLKRFSAYGG